MNEQIKNLAEVVKENGGRAMLVGGCVRDKLLGLEPKDWDCEVYGIEPAKLREILDSLGKVDAVGESFTVYKLGDLDISLPRRDKKVGKGHRGFVVEGDPSMSFEEACSRRDFTINAVMEDALTGEIVDPFNGILDLNEKLLKVVSKESFQEDSLRVLRLAQFASRFEFSIERETENLAKEVDLSDLPKERIWTEIEKMLMKSRKPSVGLWEMHLLKIDEKLFGRTLCNLDNSTYLDNAVEELRDLTYPEKLCVLLTAVLVKSESVAKDLEVMGVNKVNGFRVAEQVVALCDLANRYTRHSWYFKISQLSDYRLCMDADKARMKLLLRVLKAMKADETDYLEKKIEKLGIAVKAPEPIFKGRHLIELGIKPSPKFSDILKNMYSNQLMYEFSTEEGAMEFYRKVYE